MYSQQNPQYVDWIKVGIVLYSSLSWCWLLVVVVLCCCNGGLLYITTCCSCSFLDELDEVWNRSVFVAFLVLSALMVKCCEVGASMTIAVFLLTIIGIALLSSIYYYRGDALR